MCINMYICIILYAFIMFSLALMLSSTKSKQRTISKHTLPPHPHAHVFKVVVEKFLCLHVFLSLSGTGREMKQEGVISSPPAESRKE